MERLSHHTADLTQQNIQKIAQLFPHLVTETKVDGRTELGIDFEALKQELSDSFIEPATERYGLNWPGKRQAQFVANQPVAKTLRPNREESVNFDTTENLFIEGDNLDALKLLQNSYTGKIKLIYIDPPYNTGNDFVYNDDFAEDRDEYLLRSGAVSDTGERFLTNTETNGRFHSDWLSMMYPRLQLAKKLLREDGVIALSIDDDELPRLRQMMDEIFGERNFYACVTWQKKYSPANDAKRFSDVHDYVLFYSRSEKFVRNLFPRTAENNSSYRFDDGDGRGPYTSSDLSVRTLSESGIYPITNPKTGTVHMPPEGRCWAYTQENMERLLKEDKIYWGQNKDSFPRLKKYLSEVQQGIVPITLWTHDFAGHTDQARKEIRRLFGTTDVFDTPKPTKLIQRILQVGTTKDENDIVLDFFAGSATTAHAVLQQNAEDEGNRKFIMVQLDEAHRYEKYETVSKVSRERVRLAATELANNEELDTENLDFGFRTLTVAPSNFADVYVEPDELGQADLLAQQDSMREDRAAEDFLFEILLQLGEELSVPVTVLDDFGTDNIYSAADNTIIGCFASEVTEDLVREVAAFANEEMTQTVVFLDSALSNDALMENVHQIFKQLAPKVRVKVI